jgi:hypothetical protein
MPAGKAQRLSAMLCAILVSILTQVFIILDILALLVMLKLVSPVRQEVCTVPPRRQRHEEVARDSAHLLLTGGLASELMAACVSGYTRQAMLLMCSSQTMYLI